MTKTIRRAAARSAASLGLLWPFFTAPAALRAASASAVVSATVLGPAQTEIASGAVSVTRACDFEFDAVFPAASRALAVRSRVAAVYRLHGGPHADYSVQLAERILLTTGGSRVEADLRARLRPGGLDGDGAATVAVQATVEIPRGQAPGTYAGTYSVTVAYD